MLKPFGSGGSLSRGLLAGVLAASVVSCGETSRDSSRGRPDTAPDSASGGHPTGGVAASGTGATQAGGTGSAGAPPAAAGAAQGGVSSGGAAGCGWGRGWSAARARPRFAHLWRSGTPDPSPTELCTRRCGRRPQRRRQARYRLGARLGEGGGVVEPGRRSLRGRGPLPSARRAQERCGRGDRGLER